MVFSNSSWVISKLLLCQVLNIIISAHWTTVAGMIFLVRQKDVPWLAGGHHHLFTHLARILEGVIQFHYICQVHLTVCDNYTLNSSSFCTWCLICSLGLHCFLTRDGNGFLTSLLASGLTSCCAAAPPHPTCPTHPNYFRALSCHQNKVLIS